MKISFVFFLVNKYRLYMCGSHSDLVIFATGSYEKSVIYWK